MRKTFILLLLWPALALAQLSTKGVAYVNQASNPCPASTSCSYSSTASTITELCTAADGASAVAHRVNTSTAWSNAAARLDSWATNSVEKAFVLASGAYRSTIGTNNVAYGNNGGTEGIGFLASSTLGLWANNAPIVTVSSTGLLPNLDISYLLGSPTLRWSTLYLGRSNVGISTTNVGASISNTSAATAILNQNSPVFELEGRGWKTDATAASRAVKWALQTRPVTGAADPSGDLVFRYSINGATPSEALSLDSIDSSIKSPTSVKLQSTAVDSGTAVGVVLNGGTAGQWTNAASKIVSLRTGDVEKAYLNWNNTFLSLRSVSNVPFAFFSAFGSGLSVSNYIAYLYASDEIIVRVNTEGIDPDGTRNNGSTLKPWQNTFTRHLVARSAAAPTCSPGAALGSGGASCTCTGGADMAMECTFQAGSSGTMADTMGTITFNVAYGAAPKCVFSPKGVGFAASIGYQTAVTSTSTTTVVIGTLGTPTASASYTGIIHCIE